MKIGMNIKPKQKQPQPKRVYKKVTDKTVNVYASAVMPKMQSINPLYSLVASRAFALSKRSNDKLGTPLKKSSNLLLLGIFIIVAIVAFVAVFMLTSGGGEGGGLENAPLIGPLSGIVENFNLPSLGG